MAKVFQGFDFSGFWKDSDYARKKYVESPPSNEIIASIEAELGFRLPVSFKELMKTQNGGIPRDRCFPTKTRTSWAKDHVAISGIFGIGRTKSYSLCGDRGSKFMQQEWGYPEIGVCICNCPSAGHDMIMLDYRKCGADGEPNVVHVDQESDYKITFLAANFETFIRGLVNDSVFDTSAEDLKNALKKIESGSFSTLLSNLITKANELNFESLIRNVCQKLTVEKQCFALHADEQSWLVYDILFYLYTKSVQLADKAEYLKIYPQMMVFGNGEFQTGGYAPGFVEDWLAARLSKGEIISGSTGSLAFSEAYRREFMLKIQQFA